MRRIAVERYDDPTSVDSAGLVEGVRDDGSTWIMWMDAQGSPTLFWGRRDEGGGVIGDPVDVGLNP